MTWAIVTGMAIGAVVGGGSAALQKKDILQGALVGGVVGGVSGGIGSLMAPAAEVGVDAVAPSVLGETTSPIASNFATNAPLNSLSSTGAPVDALGQSAGDGMRLANMGSNLSGMGGGQGIAYSGSPNMAGMGGGTGITGMSPVASNGGSYLSNAGSPASPSVFDNAKNFLSENKGTIGLAGLDGGMARPASQPNTGQEDVTIHPYTYSAGLNPGYTGAGTPYFNQHYNALPTYTAKEGGIMRLGSGGNAVDAYNAKLMNNAQQEYVNSPQLGAFTSHFNDPVPLPPNADTTNMLYQKYLGRDADPAGYAANKNATPEQIAYGIQTSPEYIKSHPNAPAPVAPVAGPVNYTFNPATRGYTTSYAPAASDAGIAGLQQQQQQQLAGYGSDQNGGIGGAGGNGGGNGGGTGGSAGAGVGGNGGSAFAMGGGIGSYYPSPDDGQGGQHPQDTMMGAHPSISMGPAYPMQGIKSSYATGGGIYNLGGYSDGGRLLKGPGDGVSDDIPAQIGAKQPARLADGEFVIPARIVSELGNGSTDAGAKRLYAMMDRVQANRKKTVGKGKIAVNSKSAKYLPV